ncbi:GNAT family N-acetyltransferase [Chitinophaga sp. G-6-1-13]|uniref:GNAT family N-acetyltransferase n=1 Tax=Chitinophaga fulva TaxID=2728842 RepID=A0A848GRG2_9BACT|nr:GNAT family N-acetyltransferase [Chitinophaga fulva]NML40111.1 GNAT family N-acetyltransferase [Chitinophaga fulva]
MQSITTLTGKGDVTLKAIEHGDLKELSVLANNPAIAANLRDSFPSPYSLKDAEAFFALIQQGKLHHVWGIYVKDKIAGVISLSQQTDIYHHSAEISYWLGAPYHGKGITTEAVALLTACAFRELNIYRIYAGIFAYNDASKKVLLKNGYHLEAIKEKAIIKQGCLHDEHLMVKLNC